MYGRIGVTRSASTDGETAASESTGNVFADMDLPDPEDRLAKARLASQIVDLMSERGLNQLETAKLLGTRQPKVSQLVRGDLSGFSIERLIRFLNALGRDVEIVVRPAAESASRGTVTVAAA